MKTITEQAEEGTDKALTKFQQWMKDTFGDGKLTAVQSGEIKTLTDKIAGLETTLAAKDTTISDLQSSITTLKADHAAALTAKENEVATRVATGVTAALAKAGHKPVPAEQGADNEPKTKRDQYNALQAAGDAKSAGEFYAANREDILNGK